MNASREYLEMMISLNPKAHADSGTAHGYLFEHGKDCGPQHAPPEDIELPSREPKMCYVNAYLLADRHPERFSYVEGYAIAIIPVQHAWCMDRQGHVIDPTPHWGKGKDYFGIEFSLPTLHAIQRITHGYGALAHWEHWEAIRKLLVKPARRTIRERLQCGKIRAQRG